MSESIDGNEETEKQEVSISPVGSQANAELNLNSPGWSNLSMKVDGEDGDPDDGNSFVDCPDEWDANDSRNTDSKDGIAALGTREDISHVHAPYQGTQITEFVNGTGDLEQLRSMLEKAVAENENIRRQYQEEKESLAQGVSTLQSMLNSLTHQLSSSCGSGAVLHEAQAEDIKGDSRVDERPLNEMINDCLQLSKAASEVLLEIDTNIRDLKSSLLLKDQEIDELKAKATEFSVSEGCLLSLDKQHEMDQQAVIADRILASLSDVVNQDDLLNDSSGRKLGRVERGTFVLCEKYNKLVSELNQLVETLFENRLDVSEHDYDAKIIASFNELKELKKNEVNLSEKLSHLEEENKKLLGQLETEKSLVENLNADVGRMKTDLEHEKVKCANAKEKLGMAVTKGKALVQQRDSLKQSLADKTSELEKCLAELHQKSSALDSATVTKEELMRSQNMAVSLQEQLFQSNTLLEQVEEILSQIRLPEDIQLENIVQKLRWLVNDRGMLHDFSLEFQKLRAALSLIDLPESVLSANLESQLSWLVDSFYGAKNEIIVLQQEIFTAKEAAQHEIDSLSVSIMMELLEKDCIQEELADIRCKYGEIVAKENQSSTEKEYIMRKLAELSGLKMGDEEIDDSQIIRRCVEKLRDQDSPSCNVPFLDSSLFEMIQIHLYVRDQEFVLYKDLLEEEMNIRLEVRKLSNKLEVASDELLALKGEKRSLKADLEQSEEKCAALREKLSMAVKKGKGLVQDRENLRTRLNEKEMEIEQLKIEIQKQEALVAEFKDQISGLSTDLDTISKLEAELDAIKSERNQFEQCVLDSNNMFKRMMEPIESIVAPVDIVSEEPLEKLKWIAGHWSQCNSQIEQVKEILSQTTLPEDLQLEDTVQKLRWLVNDRNVLHDISLEFQKLKGALSLIDLPESIPANLDAQLNWVINSFYTAKTEIADLQQEIFATKEAAHHEIDRLSISFLVELLETDYIHGELADLKYKYMEAVDKENQMSTVKKQLMRKLVELSGFKMGGEGIDDFQIVDRCIEKLKDQDNPSCRASYLHSSLFERIQSLLYVRGQELVLCEDLLEEVLKEEMHIGSEINRLSNELKVASLELTSLKEEKCSLKEELEQSEEKSSVLREKLSMAVKKGKGLFQDRENLRTLLSEKNAEIEQLKVDIQKQESVIAECRDTISRLSTDLETIPILEADLDAMKAERNQFEQFLLDSNNMLKSVIESVDAIVPPVELVFEEPVEKMKWIAGYLSQCHNTKLELEQELGHVSEETSTLVRKLEEAQLSVCTLEKSLYEANINISLVSEEKKEMELLKADLELVLKKAKEDALSLTEELAHVSADKRTLEERLVKVEKDVSLLSYEKERAQASRATLEKELELMKEEVAVQSSKVIESSKTIQLLEGSLSEAKHKLLVVTEQYNIAQVTEANMESEMKKLQDEAGSQAHKLSDASQTIKSLEDALLQAQNDMYLLESEKKSAGEEIFSLHSKLNACMEELAVKNGSLVSRSVDLVGHLNDFRVLVKDDSLFSRLKQCSMKNFKSLKNMDYLLKDVSDLIVGIIPEESESHLLIEKDLHLERDFLHDLESSDIEVEMDDMNDVDGDTIFLYIRNMARGFQSRNKIIADKFGDFSCFVDEYISSLSEKLLAIKNDTSIIFQLLETLKEKLTSAEMHKQEQENGMAILENSVIALLSCCNDAIGLQFEMENENSETSSVLDLEGCNYGAGMTSVEKLLNATRKIQVLIEQFKKTRDSTIAEIEGLDNELKEERASLKKVTEERDLTRIRVLQLENDVEVLQSSLAELKSNLDLYTAREGKLQEREVELSSLYSAFLGEQIEGEAPLFLASRVEELFDKIEGIEYPISKSIGEYTEPHDSAPINKLFYIIDDVIDLKHQIKSLSRDKEELQSSLAAQNLEIGHLKEEIEKYVRNWEDSEIYKNELSMLISSLEKMLNELGIGDMTDDQKHLQGKVLVSVLERQVSTMLLESECSKSKAQELADKLHDSQKIVDELSTKVTSLENALQARLPLPDILQERSISEAPSRPSGSEISELEDSGQLGKNTVSTVPVAAHVRSLRKGSTEHLALDIDTESTGLMLNADTDEDKGHVFKSLNTSGLIPKRGKLVADRIDGLWVSGGRVLMSQPRARLGVIAYLLCMHIWLLGTVL